MSAFHPFATFRLNALVRGQAKARQANPRGGNGGCASKQKRRAKVTQFQCWAIGRSQTRPTYSFMARHRSPSRRSSARGFGQDAATCAPLFHDRGGGSGREKDRGACGPGGPRKQDGSRQLRVPTLVERRLARQACAIEISEATQLNQASGSAVLMLEEAHEWRRCARKAMSPQRLATCRAVLPDCHSPER
jgi:hypothetical protein